MESLLIGKGMPREDAKPVRGAADERLGASLLKLHAAMDAESLWSAGAALLKAAMPGFHYLMGLPSVGTKPILLRTTLPISDDPDYWARLDRVAPLEKLIAGKTGRKTGRLSDDVPLLLLRLTPFYRKFMKPEGWRYSSGMFFWDGDRFLGQFSQNRTPEQGDYTDEEMALLAELHPHFETAIRRVLILDRERATRLSVEASVHRSPLPTAVVDWDLRPLYSNRAAAEACAVWTIGAQAARAFKPEFELPADLAAACQELRSAWESTKRGETSAVVEGERMVLRPGAGSPQAWIRLFDADRAQFTRPHFLIQFSVPAAAEESDRALQWLARLSPAEREVALLAAQGSENKQIASDLAVSTSTVRTHLRHIFEKLGVKNRAMLAALFHGLRGARG